MTAIVNAFLFLDPPDGRPLGMFETLVDLIGHTHTATGLRVKAHLDKRR